HSQPLVGLARGTYQEVLGANVKLETKTFNAGPAAIEALFAGEIDAAYVGPNPALNGDVQSEGKALRIIAAATSGVALLGVRPEAGSQIFVDERDLWPNKEFVTTQLIVSTDFLDEHPTVVEKLIKAHVEITQWIKANPSDAKKLVNDGIKQVTSAGLAPEVIDAAWERLTVTYDPIASSLRSSADAAYKLGFLKDKPDL